MSFREKKSREKKRKIRKGTAIKRFSSPTRMPDTHTQTPESMLIARYAVYQAAFTLIGIIVIIARQRERSPLSKETREGKSLSLYVKWIGSFLVIGRITLLGGQVCERERNIYISRFTSLHAHFNNWVYLRRHVSSLRIWQRYAKAYIGANGKKTVFFF